MKFKVQSIISLIVVFGINAFAQEHTVVDAKSALQILIDGNKRYTETKLSHQNQSSERRTEVAKGQHPIAAILSCSDSRVPPEIIFDQGLGDLFVIRSAGNLTDDIELGSIEYAVEHLGVQLIIVLGHERCGAVEAAVKGGEAPGHIKSLVKAIHPSVEKAKKEKGDLLENSVLANIKEIVRKLKSNKPVLKKFVLEKKVEIIGARYDLDDGVVTIL